MLHLYLENRVYQTPFKGQEACQLYVNLKLFRLIKFNDFSKVFLANFFLTSNKYLNIKKNEFE
jgi:hypothetical protein